MIESGHFVSQPTDLQSALRAAIAHARAQGDDDVAESLNGILAKTATRAAPPAHRPLPG